MQIKLSKSWSHRSSSIIPHQKYLWDHVLLLKNRSRQDRENTTHPMMIEYDGSDKAQFVLHLKNQKWLKQ